LKLKSIQKINIIWIVSSNLCIKRCVLHSKVHSCKNFRNGPSPDLVFKSSNQFRLIDGIIFTSFQSPCVVPVPFIWTRCFADLVSASSGPYENLCPSSGGCHHCLKKYTNTLNCLHILTCKHIRMKNL